MKLKTMNIQKFLFIGWCPKMAHNYLIEAITENERVTTRK